MTQQNSNTGDSPNITKTVSQSSFYDHGLDEWLNKNKLAELKHIFIEHDINNIDKLY